MVSALDLTHKWGKVSVTPVNQDKWLFSLGYYVGHRGVKLWYSLLHCVMTKQAVSVFNAKPLLGITINATANRSDSALAVAEQTLP